MYSSLRWIAVGLRCWSIVEESSCIDFLLDRGRLESISVCMGVWACSVLGIYHFITSFYLRMKEGEVYCFLQKQRRERAVNDMNDRIDVLYALLRIEARSLYCPEWDNLSLESSTFYCLGRISMSSQVLMG